MAAAEAAVFEKIILGISYWRTHILRTVNAVNSVQFRTCFN